VLQENLKWNDDAVANVSSCYGTLSVIKKLKNLAPFHVRKQLAEIIVLSRLNYNDIVYHQVPDYIINRLQRVELAAAGFVLNRYSTMSDVIKLGWLPIKHNRALIRLSKIIGNALYNEDWPSYLKLEVRVPPRQLISFSELNLVVPLCSGTLQDCSARLFNNLPKDIKNCTDKGAFMRQCRNHFFSTAKAELE
jgi:hypothetical protein